MIRRLNHFIHNHLLKLLLLMYGLAVVMPKFGIAIKNINLGHIYWGSRGSINFSLPLLMLSFLLLNAGLSVRLSSLRKVILVPAPLILGVLCNLLMPLIFTFIFALFGKIFWHNPEEIQTILVGLAIIASMPIAGSSTAWVQNTNGNTALILGLVVVTTILSPLISPMVFHLIGLIATGDYSENLHKLASQGTSSFLIISVVVPTLIGIGLRATLSERKWDKLFPLMNLLNLTDLLLLNYSNASVSLPTAVSSWDFDFLIMIFCATSLLCVFSFTAGWMIPRFFKVPTAERIALTYGLGMNNNGTGLVLASTSLADYPLVLIPIIFYNLGQQIVAGIFNNKMKKSSSSTR